MRLLVLGLGASAVLALAGCSSAALPETSSRSAPMLPPAPAATIAPETTATRSALSYGTVTARVQKNQTTQLELLELFGGANITTTDADGTEVWVYERIVTQTDVAAQTRDFHGAANLGLFFNFANFGAQAGGSVERTESASAASSTTSTRTLTVIVKFNPDRTVKDYSVRATYF